MGFVQIDIQPMLDRDYLPGTNPVRSTVGRYAASPMSVSHPTTARRPAGRSSHSMRLCGHASVVGAYVLCAAQESGLRLPAGSLWRAVGQEVSHGPWGRSRSAPRRLSTAGTG
jgi:hypothetical protein